MVGGYVSWSRWSGPGMTGPGCARSCRCWFVVQYWSKFWAV